MELTISGVPDANYHLYRAEPGTKETNFRTTFVISEKSKLLFGNAEPSVKHIAKDIGGTIYEIHEGPISWKIPIVIPNDASPGLHRFEGLVGYQACTDELCDQPLGFRFQGELNVDGQGQGNRRTLQLLAIKFKEVASSVHRMTWVDDLAASSSVRSTSQDSVAEPKTSDLNQVETVSSDRSKQEEAVAVLPVSQIAQAFVFAILGGFILNFMPCVLPVIGLKVLAFVEESEGSAKHVVWLNFCYIMGTMAVVMALGVATVIANHYSYNLMWGGQFGSQGFRIAILVLVFAMALSFLGVWEIPIPGFATSKKSSELMSKEGGTGAFFKGVITTVLATPCTGPFLGTALTFTLGQPDWIVLLVFFGIGLGISLPFIAIMFFPQAMKWLPKPGPWMDTLKQGLAFPLLFTVVFFLTTFSADYRIAAVSLLIGVWFACWWIGKIPAWAERKSKAMGWAGACVSAVAIGLFSFQYLGPSPKHIDWKTYNETELAQAVKSGKTVMIEFTAEWCANCKTNMRIAIDTDRVAAAIKSKSVVPMIADFTDFPEHIQEKLDELRCRGIPVLAFYPAGMMDQPVVLQGLLTESQVLKAIEETTGKTSGKWTPVSTSVP